LALKKNISPEDAVIMIRARGPLQKARLMLQNHLREKKVSLTGDDSRHVLLPIFKEVLAIEKWIDKRLKGQGCRHPEWEHFQTKGVSDILFLQLIKEIKTLSRFTSHGKLWSFCGYGLKNGKVQKAGPGQIRNWSADVKKTCFKIFDQFRKHQDCHYYKSVYLPHFELLQDQIQPDVVRDIPWMNANKLPIPERIEILAFYRARRYTIKTYLKDCWKKNWRNKNSGLC